jgi:hypothetical protein
LTSSAVITALFGLGVWSFHAMWAWAVSRPAARCSTVGAAQAPGGGIERETLR